MSRNRPKSLRRKPKQARARDTVAVVLDAAARVLSRRGYAAATTNRIAETAGVSVGTVYEYFANKEAVFDALIAREIAVLVTAFEGQDLEGASLEETLDALLAAGLDAMPHGPELFRALEAVPGSSFRRQLSRARKGVIELVERLLAAHRAELRVSDPGLAAFVVVSAVEGVAANATSEVFDRRLAAELSGLVKLYLTGAETG